MIAGPFRRTAAALALASLLLTACTGDRAPVAAAADISAPVPSPAPVSATASALAASDGGAVPATDLDRICAEDDIACHERFYQLEETLFLYEAGIANQIGEQARACWRADSEAFRRTLAGCGDNACREAALRERLASLHFLQPEGNRATLELPSDAAQLVAVLGPETEAAAAAGTPVPFEARGGLVHASDHPEHMGVAVQAAGGEQHVFIHDMDIGNQPGHDEVLGLVGTSPTARILVRGHRSVAPDGVADFDVASCRLVHQLP